MSHSLDRRSFLGSVGLAAGAASLPSFARDLDASAAPITADWDLNWVNALDRVKHKQVFDMGSLEYGMHVVTNYLDAFQSVMKLTQAEVVAVVGIASSTFPMNASDALWSKHALGEKWKVRDPDTGEWATRNIYAADPAPKGGRDTDAIGRLVQRGTIFWQCHNALMGVSRRLAGPGVAIEPMYEELKAGLLPHVKIVPAHTMLIGLVQEHGCTYEKL